MGKKLVTSALPYANGYIHLGHLAGAYLPADIYVRYQRLKGEEILYVCGSDEHGVAITIAAEKEGVSPREIIDKYHTSNKDAFEKIGISFDIYSRTSNKLHHETAKEFFEDFLKKEFLVKRESEQFFDKKANMFLPDRYVEGICPNCGKDGARGDQCDNCGAYYSQTELKSPISLVSKEAPILKNTVHWYFKFQEFQSFLEDYISSKEGIWKDNVIQQSRSWLKAGLAERAITRDLEWGVDLKGIEGVSEDEANGKRLYVWFDAVLGYITATKEYFGNDDWKKWWQGEDTDYIAFIGKDNIVFHTLIFPAMLYGRRDEDNKYILPSNVPANEFLNLEGQKFSKSKNWSIDLKDFVSEHSEDSSLDTMRYSLAMNFPETRDSDFTWKDYQARGNNELAAILGNFVNRTLLFLQKNFDSKVPELKGEYTQYTEHINSYLKDNTKSNLEENDKLLLDTITEEMKNIEKNWNSFRFRDGIVNIMNIARASNKYFNDEEPWKSIKTDNDKSAKTLFVCTQLIRTLSILFAPIIPKTSQKIQKILNVNEELGLKTDIANNIWANSIKFELKSGHLINTPEILFPKIEDEFIEKEFAKLGNLNKVNQIAKSDEKPEGIIEFSDFMNVKLKTAKILSAEKIAKSDKLIKLQVDLAYEKRQIVAGIGLYYKTEDLIGKIIIIVANLKPAKLMGEISEGMLLAANYSNGLKLATFDGDVELGVEVR